MANFNAPVYLRLVGTSKSRLAFLRARAESSNLASWRDARKYRFDTWSAAYSDMSQGFNFEGSRKTRADFICG